MIALRHVRDGAVVREALVAGLPASIGRDPASAFVIADASVSRAHARLERDASGALVLTDLDSANGVFSGNERVKALPIPGPVRCRLGAVELEIEPVSEDPTLRLRLEDVRHFDQRRGLGHHVAYLAVGVAGIVASELMLPSFWSPWQRSRASELLGSLFAALLLLPLLAFFLFVALKAAGRRVRVADTLGALARVVWLGPLWLALNFAAYYVLGGGGLAVASQVLTWAAVLASVVLLATLRRPGRSRAFKAAWAVALSVLWAGMSLTQGLAARRLGMPDNSYEVLPPIAGFAGVASDLPSYLARVRSASERAAAAAEDVRVRQDR